MSASADNALRSAAGSGIDDISEKSLRYREDIMKSDGLGILGLDVLGLDQSDGVLGLHQPRAPNISVTHVGLTDVYGVP